jgi:hypothetical protein
MSTNSQPAKEASRKGAKPTYTAYHVQDAAEEGGKALWSKIGVYFAHEDGQGGTVKLDSLPIHFDGRIVLRAPKAE